MVILDISVLTTFRTHAQTETNSPKMQCLRYGANIKTVANTAVKVGHKSITVLCRLQFLTPVASWVGKSSRRDRKLQFSARRLEALPTEMPDILLLPINFPKIPVFSPKFCHSGQNFSDKNFLDNSRTIHNLGVGAIIPNNDAIVWHRSKLKCINECSIQVHICLADTVVIVTRSDQRPQTSAENSAATWPIQPI